MAYQRGENVNIGIGVQSNRDTHAASQFWLPGRTPSGIKPVLEKVLLKETRGTAVASQGSLITQARAEGDLDHNLRANSLGAILKSLLGTVVSAAVNGQSGAYDHTFSLLNNAQHPMLTLNLVQPGYQAYRYVKTLATKVELDFPVNDIANCKTSFISQSEIAHDGYAAPDYTGIDTNDPFFMTYQVIVQIGNTTASLSTVLTKALKIDINNGGKPNQNISEYYPGDIRSMLLSITGSIEIDYQDATWHNIFTAGTYQAMRIIATRSDISIGLNTNPTMTLTFPKVSFEGYDPNRSLEGITTDKINFVAHADPSSGNSAISVVLRNTTTDYTGTTGSSSPSASTSASSSSSQSPSASRSPSASLSKSPSPSA